MKVFCWAAMAGSENAHCIVAVPTKAAAARAAGYPSPARMRNLGTTHNDEEIRIASAEPGTVFVSLGLNYPKTYQRRGDMYLYGSVAPRVEGVKP